MLSISFLYENIISKNKTGKMIAHFIPFDTARELKSIADNLKGQTSAIKDFHITLGFVRAEQNKKKEIFNSLKLLSHYIEPFEAQIEKFEIFPASENSDNHEILVAIPNPEPFEKVHSLTFDVFEKFKIPIDNGDFEFKPHITIKYIKPGQQVDPLNLKFDKKIQINTISFEGNGLKKTFTLGED